MPASPERPIGIFYEHPDWFRPLFSELDRRGTPYEKIHAARHRFDPAEPVPYSLVFNRMSPSAWLRGHGYKPAAWMKKTAYPADTPVGDLIRDLAPVGMVATITDVIEAEFHPHEPDRVDCSLRTGGSRHGLSQRHSGGTRTGRPGRSCQPQPVASLLMLLQ